MEHAVADSNPILWAIDPENACEDAFVTDMITKAALSYDTAAKATILKHALFGVVGSDRDHSTVFVKLLLDYGADASYEFKHESVLEHAIRAHDFGRFANLVKAGQGTAALLMRAGMQEKVVAVLLEHKNAGLLKIPSEHFQKAVEAAYWKYPNVLNTFRSADADLTATTLKSITAHGGDLDWQFNRVEHATGLHDFSFDQVEQATRLQDYHSLLKAPLIVAAGSWNLPLTKFILNYRMAQGRDVAFEPSLVIAAALGRRFDLFFDRGFTEHQLTEFVEGFAEDCPESERAHLLKLACQHRQHDFLPEGVLKLLLGKSLIAVKAASMDEEEICKDVLLAVQEGF